MSTPWERAGDEQADRCVQRRDEAERVLALAEHLSRPDRLLVQRVLGDGMTVADFARLQRRSPRTLQSRLRGCIRRINSREYRYVVGHRDLLPRSLRAVARRLVLEGRGLRDTARLTGRSLHAVRQERARLAVLLEERLRRANENSPDTEPVEKFNS
ncbi:MAG: hypothetical protein AAF710_00665 [Planctomycetota bacterium]